MPAFKNLLNVPPCDNLHERVAQGLRENYDGVQLSDGNYPIYRVPVLNPQPGRKFVLQGSDQSRIYFADNVRIADQNWTAPLLFVASGGVTVRRCLFDMRRTEWVGGRTVVTDNIKAWMLKYLKHADGLKLNSNIDNFTFERNKVIDSVNARKPSNRLIDNWAVVMKQLSDGTYINSYNMVYCWDMELTGSSQKYRYVDMDFNVVRGGLHRGGYISSLAEGTKESPEYVVKRARYRRNRILNWTGSAFALGFDSDDICPYRFELAEIYGNSARAIEHPSKFAGFVTLKLYRDPGTFRIWSNMVDATLIDPDLTTADVSLRSITGGNNGWNPGEATG